MKSADGTATKRDGQHPGHQRCGGAPAPDVANLVETDAAAAISTSGTLTISSDVDKPCDLRRRRPARRALTAPSRSMRHGAWSYTASSAHNEFVDGATYTDTFSVKSADGTAHQRDGQHPGHQRCGGAQRRCGPNLVETDAAAAISTSGTLTIIDVDSPATFVAQAATAGAYGTFAIDAAGAWTYTASSAHNEFVDGTTYTDTFSVNSADGTPTSVTVSILGTNDAAVLSADVANLVETDVAAAISTSGTLTISDVDSPATFVAQAATAGTYGTFAIDAAGAWTYTASSAHNEFVARRHLHRHLLGGERRRHRHQRDGQHPGHQRCGGAQRRCGNLVETNAAAAISTSGTLTISDVDSPATFVAQAATAGLQHLRDRCGRGVELHRELGPQRVRGRHHLHRHLLGGQCRRHHHQRDGQHPGTNDAAVPSSDTKNLTETNSVLTTGGTLTVTDVDSPATFVAQAGTAGTYGTFAIDAAGVWTYTASSAHNEFVAGTTYTEPSRWPAPTARRQA